MVQISRRAGAMIGLVLVWCALWGSFSVANLAGGAAVVAGLWVIGMGRPAVGNVRLVPLAKLVGLVVIDLTRSTFNVVKAVLQPHSIDERIIVVELSDEAYDHLLLVVTAVTLTPGTAVVDKLDNPGRLRLHLLDGSDADEVVDHVHQLVELTNAAFGPRRRPTEVTS